MACQPRIRYTDELRSEICDKYQQGDTLWSIARSINRSSSSIYRRLAPTGGIRPPGKLTRVPSRNFSLTSPSRYASTAYSLMSIPSIPAFSTTTASSTHLLIESRCVCGGPFFDTDLDQSLIINDLIWGARPAFIFNFV